MVRWFTRLRVPEWMRDGALAVLVAAMQMLSVHRVAPGQAARALADPVQLGYVLLAASGLLLTARRRWPRAVFAAIAALSLGYYAAGYPDGPGWLALFVAVYTLTAYGDGRGSLRIAAGGLVALTAGWLATADLSPLLAAGWVFFRIGGAVMAASLGESVRSRHLLTVQAQRRAEHAERTREELARRRVDAERLRIAREVHDTVAHALSVINVHAGVTAHILGKRPEQAGETLATIERTSAQALRELRATLGMLRDEPGGRGEPEPGLARVDELVATARRAGLDLDVDVLPPPPDLPGAVDHAAYRVVQESITNAIRHAGTAHVTVRVAYTPEYVEVAVSDDGPGPDGAGDGQGRGLRGMRERCWMLGGELTAGPRPGGGFSVRARLPARAAVPS